MGVGVAVAGLAVGLGVFVAAGLGVFVAVGLGVFVAVGLGVFVAVGLGVFVAVGLGVFVAVGLGVGVAVGSRTLPGERRGVELAIRVGLWAAEGEASESPWAQGRDSPTSV